MKANLFNLDDLNNIPILSDIINQHKKKVNKNNKELVLRQVVREIINEMVGDVIKNTKKNIKLNKLKIVSDVFKIPNPIVCFSSKMHKFDVAIKKFLRENMYYSKNVIKKTNRGKKIINDLFTTIIKNPKKYIKSNDYKKNKERVVCDFIAGMTDRYAINLHNKIK